MRVVLVVKVGRCSVARCNRAATAAPSRDKPVASRDRANGPVDRGDDTVPVVRVSCGLEGLVICRRKVRSTGDTRAARPRRRPVVATALGQQRAAVEVLEPNVRDHSEC